ncbi:hypothetical protein [Roseibium sp.]|uniref:hypothetical protein n=1 Tax=Roseibium sp. TaxID=1936156 RepID=UPI003268C94A
MATNTAGNSARYYNKQMVHYLRAGLAFGDNGTAVTVGIIPAGSVILKAASGVQVTTAFNAGTGNVLDVGTSDNDDLFGTDLALGTATFVPLDEAIGGYHVTSDTTITATVALTGTAASAGAAEVLICYIPDNDR